MHWSQRRHGALTDTMLRDRIANTYRDAERLTSDRAAAQRKVEQLHAVADAGRGRHLRAVEDNLACLREQAQRVRDADQIEARWREATERAADAAEQRAHAEHDLERLART